MAKRPITTLTPWYGSNRTCAEEVGLLLEDARFVCVAFGGGLSEIRHLKASTIVVGDLHQHQMNLATVAAHPRLGPMLFRRVRRRILHPAELRAAQLLCIEVEEGRRPLPDHHARLDWAVAYFTAAWMGRNGLAGKPAEFTTKLCTRWDAGGGDPATRWRSASEALVMWRKAFARCTFEVRDFRAMLERVKASSDVKRAGVYLDPPFNGAPGKQYTHSFSDGDHRDLADHADGFEHAAVVVRLYEHPDLDELYPADRWARVALHGRDQHQKTKKPERLLCRNIDPTTVIRARVRQKAEQEQLHA